MNQVKKMRSWDYIIGSIKLIVYSIMSTRERVLHLNFFFAKLSTAPMEVHQSPKLAGVQEDMDIPFTWNERGAWHWQANLAEAPIFSNIRWGMMMKEDMWPSQLWCPLHTISFIRDSVKICLEVSPKQAEKVRIDLLEVYCSKLSELGGG